ncbi:MAG: precorrin-6y C5,15-methyltransferase (decarboxylating) subunit CbiE [Proteobacteria bacterium]|nr:precorrin-6y C5,15-methyltransferase (decarboxylating) subunit CbiE [Pseudomonadota bacterium]MBU1140107.1 precorrin-6y C5,15-methyltransferase (decarboxylating) subunit CbiE [Pseudomonadota bacterium]
MGSVLHLVGFADSAGHDFSALLHGLRSSVILVASTRLYQKLMAMFPEEHIPPHIPVVPLDTALQRIKDSLQDGDVTVLASGDPLFFGIGRKLISVFPEVEIQITPALSSMQLAFSRFQIPWDDAHFVSLHGRPSENLSAVLLRWPKVFVLTDRHNSPTMIARYLLKECVKEKSTEIEVHVGENIGFESERLVSGNLEAIAAQHFVDPNVMILVNRCPFLQTAPCFGLQESEIQHSRGLITKNEVRAASIHALRLSRDGVFWDVGAGSGSVGLEVARLFPELRVLAIEKEEGQWRNIETNRKRFAAWNLELVKGMAPEVLHDLPDPTRVFVGGSGGNLEQILDLCVARLLPGGIVVVNAVIEKTATQAPEILYRRGLEVEVRELVVQRFSYPEGERQQYNPIKIIVGKKEIQEPVYE